MAGAGGRGSDPLIAGRGSSGAEMSYLVTRSM
jgi:hypothetical protein